MPRIIITTDTEDQADEILSALLKKDEDGEFDFPFNVESVPDE